MASSTASTDRSISIRCSTPPPSRCARTRCTRPCCTAAASSAAPIPPTSPRCTPRWRSGGRCARCGSSPPPSTWCRPRTDARTRGSRCGRPRPGQARAAISGAVRAHPGQARVHRRRRRRRVLQRGDGMGDGEPVPRRPRPGGGVRPAGLLRRPQRRRRPHRHQDRLRSHPRRWASPTESSTAAAFARRIGVAPPRHQTVRQALESGPDVFCPDHGRRSGSRDGREVALALDDVARARASLRGSTTANGP